VGVRLISKNIVLAFVVPVLLCGQGADSPAPVPADAHAAPDAPVNIAPSGQTPTANPLNQEPPGGKRVFGVLPNYRTASAEMEGSTLTSKQKLTIAAKDSFDYPLVLLAAAFAGLDQLGNDDPSFGQGVKGYAHRLGAWYLDESIGNMMTEGIFPAMLHQDPRYFRKGSGSIMSRTGYAVSRVIITDKDGGAKQFNYSEWLGNATGVAISQAYHPDNRTARDATELLLEQVGTDAISQVLKEFWPDIKRKVFHRGNAQDTAFASSR
jgi:hypothetical protein